MRIAVPGASDDNGPAFTNSCHPTATKGTCHMKTMKAALLITLLVSPNWGYAEQWSDPTEIKDAHNNIGLAEANYSRCIERAIEPHKKSGSDDVHTATHAILKQCDGELASVKQAAEAANMQSPVSDRFNQMVRNRGELKALRALYYERAKRAHIIQ